MLPQSARLRRSAEFASTVRHAPRVGRRTVVVHCAKLGNSADDAAAPKSAGGDRLGLIVSKGVGNSVVRHRVSRKLRHIVSEVFSERSESGPGVVLVIRALPASAEASSAELRRDVRGALRRLGVTGAER